MCELFCYWLCLMRFSEFMCELLSWVSIEWVLLGKLSQLVFKEWKYLFI
jgi:hypothetical protein